MVIVGGRYTPKTVSVYNMDGWVRDLPNLNQGRTNLACGHYLDDNGDQVSIKN